MSSKIHKMSLNNTSITQQQVQASIADFRYEEQLKVLLKKRYRPDQLEELLSLFNSSDVMKRHHGIIGIRTILSLNEDKLKQKAINLGILPKLKELMSQQEFPQLKVQAAWIFTNIAAGIRPLCRAVVELGIIPLFFDMIRQKNALMIQLGLCGIGNIAADGNQLRDDVINAGGVKALIEVLQTSSNQILLRIAASSLATLCIGQPLPKKQTVSAAILPLCQFLASKITKTNYTLRVVCKAIAQNLDDADPDKLIIRSGLIPVLFELLGNLDYYFAKITVSVLTIFGKVALGEDRQLLLQQGILPKLDFLLQNSVSSIQVCSLIAIIATGTMQQVDTLIKYKPIITKLFGLLVYEGRSLRRQACIVFRNIGSNGNLKDVFLLFQNRQIICKIAAILKKSDAPLVMAALECLKVVFSIGFKQTSMPGNPFAAQFQKFGGKGHLQRLRCHREDTILEYISVIQELLSMANE